ncbi:hypothetical protein C8R44DRAFT_884695 [Mycena epipterygia]|nr:hypothetical protein C8R44DRAFT_884695 [Mycena epipterygia]
MLRKPIEDTLMRSQTAVGPTAAVQTYNLLRALPQQHVQPAFMRGSVRGVHGHAGAAEVAQDEETGAAPGPRSRTLGGAPSADVYGILILYVKGTSDDTSNAMILFRESQVQRVIPN